MLYRAESSGKVITDEQVGIRKDAVIVYLRYFAGTSLEWLWKTTTEVSQNIGYRNWIHREYSSGTLPLPQCARYI